MPGVCVDERRVELPLSKDGDAPPLVKLSRQASFGMGNQTLVDETVRKTWEIDADRITFKNPAWSGWVDGIVRKVAVDLGVVAGSDNVQAELHKMLLYEEGAMFKPHKE